MPSVAVRFGLDDVVRAVEVAGGGFAAKALAGKVEGPARRRSDPRGPRSTAANARRHVPAAPAILPPGASLSGILLSAMRFAGPRDVHVATPTGSAAAPWIPLIPGHRTLARRVPDLDFAAIAHGPRRVGRLRRAERRGGSGYGHVGAHWAPRGHMIRFGTSDGRPSLPCPFGD